MRHGASLHALTLPAEQSRQHVPWLFRVLHLDRRLALPVAVTLSLLAGLGDALTSAEAMFTLFYLLPIGIAVWFHGGRIGVTFVLALCIFLSLGVDSIYGPHRSLSFVIWNSIGEVGLYFLFAFLINALKTKLATEAELRKETLKQLRHADRLTTVGRLAAGLAHELGTPLNVVSGKASLISAGYLEGEKVKTSARVIEQQAGRMAAIVRHLLDFSRRGGTHRESADLRVLCDETADLLRPLAKNCRVELVCNGCGAEVPINRSEIQQVLSNLITNSIHAMPRGGTVNLTCSREDGMAVLRVTDDGTGIEPHILPRIFDPFFTTKDVGEGTGLGLSVVHGIVADHGGSIEVTSEAGHGTTFTVRLPR